MFGSGHKIDERDWTNWETRALSRKKNDATPTTP